MDQKEEYFADCARALSVSFFDLASCILLSKSYKKKNVGRSKYNMMVFPLTTMSDHIHNGKPH